MQRLTCEMCGSNDIIKKDGFYVCESCGTKYSIEEAKKLMVDISGSNIKIDRSADITNLYTVARRAKNTNDFTNASIYYQNILTQDPNSWEAYFYTIYCQVMCCKIAQIESECYRMTNAIGQTLMIVPKNQNTDTIIKDISARINYLSSIMFEAAKKTYNEMPTVEMRQGHRQEMINRSYAAINMRYVLGDSLISTFGEKYKIIASDTWQSAIISSNQLMMYLFDKKPNKTIIKEYSNKVKNIKNAIQKSETESIKTVTRTPKTVTSNSKNTLKLVLIITGSVIGGIITLLIIGIVLLFIFV